MTFKIKTVKLKKDSGSPYFRLDYVNAIPKEFLTKRTTLTELGSGAFGTVYDSKTPGRVVKICDFDSAYACYVKELSKLNKKKKNPHFPTIFNVTVFEFKDDRSALVVEMERLNPMKPAKYDYGWNYSSMTPLNESAEIVASFDWSNRRFKRSNWFLTGNKELLEAREFLAKTYKKYNRPSEMGVGNDMGCSNIMLRDDGTPVVTDPFS